MEAKTWYLCNDKKCMIQYTGPRELAQAYADEQGLTLREAPMPESGESNGS